MSKKNCASGKIFDFVTKRCIGTNSKTFKERVEDQIKNGTKRFDPEDLIKLGYITQPTKHTEVIQNNKTKLSNEIKENLKKKLDQAKENIKYEYKYVNEDHKNYCKFKNTMLKEPIIDKFIIYSLTYMKSPIYGPFNTKMLMDIHKNKWTVSELCTGMTEATNWDRMNKLPTDEETMNAVDIDWFLKMNKYIQDLTDEQLFAIKGYTFHGDVLMNNFLRKTFDIDYYIQTFDLFTYTTNYFPLFFPLLRMVFEYRKNLDALVIDKLSLQFAIYNKHFKKILGLFKPNDTSYIHGWEAVCKTDYKKVEQIYTAILHIVTLLKKQVIEEAIQLLIRTLNDVINKSPSTTRKMTLYRGDQNDDYFKVDTGNKFFKIKGFISTSLSKIKAKEFAGDKCCMNEITVLPGSKCLFVMGVSSYPEEIEVLLSMNTTYLMRSHRLKSYPPGKDLCSTTRTGARRTTKLVAL